MFSSGKVFSSASLTEELNRARRACPFRRYKGGLGPRPKSLEGKIVPYFSLCEFELLCASFLQQRDRSPACLRARGSTCVYYLHSASKLASLFPFLCVRQGVSVPLCFWGGGERNTYCYSVDPICCDNGIQCRPIRGPFEVEKGQGVWVAYLCGGSHSA